MLLLSNKYAPTVPPHPGGTMDLPISEPRIGFKNKVFFLTTTCPEFFAEHHCMSPD